MKEQEKELLNPKQVMEAFLHGRKLSHTNYRNGWGNDPKRESEHYLYLNDDGFICEEDGAGAKEHRVPITMRHGEKWFDIGQLKLNYHEDWKEELFDLAEKYCNKIGGKCLYHILEPFISKELTQARQEGYDKGLTIFLGQIKVREEEIRTERCDKWKCGKCDMLPEDVPLGFKHSRHCKKREKEILEEKLKEIVTHYGKELEAGGYLAAGLYIESLIK